jgi:hypothetical protein
MIANADEAAAIAAALGILFADDLRAAFARAHGPMLWQRLEHPRSWSELARIEALNLEPDVV